MGDRLIKPVLLRMTREMARAGTMLKVAERIRSGITTVNDMFMHLNPGSYASLGVADGLDEVGLGGAMRSPSDREIFRIRWRRPRFSMSTRPCTTASAGPPISASGWVSAPFTRRPTSYSASRSG
jgi:hypothetical protein